MVRNHHHSNHSNPNHPRPCIVRPCPKKRHPLAIITTPSPSAGGVSALPVISANFLCWALLGLVLAVVLGTTGTALGIYKTVSDSNDSGGGSCGACGSLEDAVDPTTLHDNSTLYRILNRGYLNCGVGPLGAPGFLWETSPGTFAGLEVDVCTAVAAALFGNDNLERSTEELNQDDYTGTSRVRLIPIPPEHRWQYLLHHPDEPEHGVDVLFRSTHTLERDVYEPTTQHGFEFSTPYVWDNLVVGGSPTHVACAEALDFELECANTVICVTEGTTH